VGAVCFRLLDIRDTRIRRRPKKPNRIQQTNSNGGGRSAAGDGWSDGQLVEALDTSIDTIERTGQLLVEGGVEATLTRKDFPNSARK